MRIHPPLCKIALFGFLVCHWTVLAHAQSSFQPPQKATVSADKTASADNVEHYFPPNQENLQQEGEAKAGQTDGKLDQVAIPAELAGEALQPPAVQPKPTSGFAPGANFKSIAPKLDGPIVDEATTIAPATSDFQPAAAANSQSVDQMTPPATRIAARSEFSTPRPTNQARTAWVDEPLRGNTSSVPGAFRTDKGFAAGNALAIQTAIPRMIVNTSGPAEISLNKTARYEVEVANTGNHTANSIIVGIDFPEHVEIMSSRPSVGSHEMTDGTIESRVIWSLPAVAAGTSEKFVFELTPRQARVFDVNVEWTFLPVQGHSKIVVTETKN